MNMAEKGSITGNGQKISKEAFAEIPTPRILFDENGITPDELKDAEADVRTAEQFDLDGALKNNFRSRSLTLLIHEARKYPRLKREEERGLAHRKDAGDEKAGEALVNHNLFLVVAIASRYHGAGLPLEDRVQEGNLALMRAAQKYNPDNETVAKFATYAAVGIKRGIKRAIAEQADNKNIKVPENIQYLSPKVRNEETIFLLEHHKEPSPQEIAKRLDVKASDVENARLASGAETTISLDAPLRDNGDDERTLYNIRKASLEYATEKVNRKIDGKKFRETFINMLNEIEMSERERRIMDMRNAIGEYDVEYLPEEIAPLVGLIPTQVRGVESKIFRKLRVRYGKELQEYLS
jgi:RNA polymerase primary sigma factor